eukprot:scaffold133193_cov26-Tisochrysis_lutea.AAC.5
MSRQRSSTKLRICTSWAVYGRSSPRWPTHRKLRAAHCRCNSAEARGRRDRVLVRCAILWGTLRHAAAPASSRKSSEPRSGGGRVRWTFATSFASREGYPLPF